MTQGYEPTSRASNNTMLKNFYLNKDCIVNYYGRILSSEVANQYFDLLMQNIQWENDDLVFFDKHVTIHGLDLRIYILV
jgi:hypothetical protein